MFVPLGFYNGCKSIFKGGVFVVALLCFGIGPLDPKIHPEKYIETARNTLKKKVVGGRDWTTKDSTHWRRKQLMAGLRGRAEMSELDPQALGSGSNMKTKPRPGRKQENFPLYNIRIVRFFLRIKVGNHKQADAFDCKSIKCFAMDGARSHGKR